MDGITEHFFGEPHLQHLNPIAIGNTYIYKSEEEWSIEVEKITKEGIGFQFTSSVRKDKTRVFIYLYESSIFLHMRKSGIKPIKKRTRLRFLNDK